MSTFLVAGLARRSKPLSIWPAVAAGLGLLISFAPASGAETYPMRPVRLVVPYAAGGANDSFARLLAKGMGERLKQSFIVDNRPGAGQVIGSDAVARSAPNGETLLLGGVVHAINAGLLPRLPYDPVKDFIPISILATSPLVCVVPTSLGIKDMASLVQMAISQPGRISYASAGNGSPGHLAVESIKIATKAPMTHIPYKGASQPINDLLSGLVHFMCTSPISVMPFVKEGKLTPLAVTSNKRSEVFPNVPTLRETGSASREIGTWYALLAPAGTDRSIIDQLNATALEVIKSPRMKEMFKENGLTAVGSSQQEADQYLRSEISGWTQFIKSAGISAD